MYNFNLWFLDFLFNLLENLPNPAIKKAGSKRTVSPEDEVPDFDDDGFEPPASPPKAAPKRRAKSTTRVATDIFDTIKERAAKEKAQREKDRPAEIKERQKANRYTPYERAPTLS